jgi:hypothetical protein
VPLIWAVKSTAVLQCRPVQTFWLHCSAAVPLSADFLAALQCSSVASAGYFADTSVQCCSAALHWKPPCVEVLKIGGLNLFSMLR